MIGGARSCTIDGCGDAFGPHADHCNTRAPEDSSAWGSPCIRPRDHDGPHTYGTPGLRIDYDQDEPAE